MWDWEIRNIYEDLLDKYQHRLGATTDNNVIVTENYLKTLKKRLKELNVYKNGTI